MSSFKISLIAIFLLTLLFLGKGIWPGQTYYIRDITYFFSPQRIFSAQCLQQGEIPLWNHYSNFGMPFLANWQSGIFYPGNLFFYFFGFGVGLKLFLIFSFFLAGLGAYLFSRKFFSAVTSSGVAIVFLGGGFLLSKLEFLSSVAVYPWLFFLLLLDNVFVLAIAIALAFFGGHQAFFYLLGVTLIFKIFFCIQGKTFSFIRNFFFSGLVAIFLVAIQFFPTTELFLHSSRRTGLEIEVASAKNFGFRHLGNIIAPWMAKYLKAAAVIQVYGEKYPWAQTSYIGLVAFVLSIYGFFVAPRAVKYLTSLLVILGIALCLGKNSFFYQFLYDHFKLFHLFRFPGPLIIFTIGGLIILFGYGLESVKNQMVKLLLVCLVALELLIYCWPSVQGTTYSNYLYMAPETAVFLQSALSGQRFILSPETECNRKVSLDGMNPWQKVKNFLSGYIALPYRILNTYSSGEPLIPRRSFAWIDNFYKLSPQKALKQINETNIGAMISRNLIPQFSGIKSYPINNAIVYYFNNKHRLVEFVNANQPREYIIRNNKIIFTGESGQLIFYETYYPGWKLFVNGKKILPRIYQDTFQTYYIKDTVGNSVFCLAYKPFSFLAGAIISTFTLLIVVWCLLIKSI